MPTEQNTAKDEDVDDQFRALLEGLRLTIPAVAVLFSFLLTLPLQAAFSDLRPLEKVVFYIAFISASLATVLVVAPSAHQRMRAPISGIRRRTPSDVAVATWLSIAGTVAFAVSIAAASYLVSALILPHDLFAGIITTVVAGVTAWTWFYMPVVSFSRDDKEE